jgi:hypothetical protein
MPTHRLKPWLFAALAGSSVMLVVWTVSDRWRVAPSPDSKPFPSSQAEPQPGAEIASSVAEPGDKQAEAAAASGPDAALPADFAGKVSYSKIKDERRRRRQHPDVTANSPEDRIKALSRLAELGYKPWEAEELRTLWDGEMDVMDRELERLRMDDPDRSLSMDRRLLERGAYTNLREGLDASDYVAVRYSAEKTTRLEVYRVTSGTLEEEFGLLPGDQLDSYEGERLYDLNQFRALTEAEIDPDRPVVLGFLRNGSEFFLEIPGGDVQVPLLGVVAPP